MFELIGSKYGVCCTSFQSFEKFGARGGKRESSKNWIFRCFPNPNPNTVSLRGYQLILCMLRFMHSLEHEIRKLIPKGAFGIIT